MFLEAFEGPLDLLLLYLIRRQNFNILDIPMLSVTPVHNTIERISHNKLAIMFADGNRTDQAQNLYHH